MKFLSFENMFTGHSNDLINSYCTEAKYQGILCYFY